MRKRETMDSSNVKRAVKFLQEFFDDFGLLFVELDKELRDQLEMIPHPDAGNKSTWDLSSHIEKPKGWIVKDLHRMYLSAGSSSHETAILFMLPLFPEALLSEAALVCSQLHFRSAMTSKDIWNETWKAAEFRSMVTRESCWSLSDASSSPSDVRLAMLDHRDPKSLIESASVFAVDTSALNDRDAIDRLIIRPLSESREGGTPALSEAIVFNDALVSAWRRS